MIFGPSEQFNIELTENIKFLSKSKALKLASIVFTLQT